MSDQAALISPARAFLRRVRRPAHLASGNSQRRPRLPTDHHAAAGMTIGWRSEGRGTMGLGSGASPILSSKSWKSRPWSLPKTFGSSIASSGSVTVRGSNPEVGGRVDPVGSGSWIKSHPTVTVEPQLDPSMSVALTHNHQSVFVDIARCEPQSHPSRDVQLASHDRHGGRELLTVTSAEVGTVLFE